MAATYLRHTTTGEIYPFNADMSRRADMEELQYTPAQLKKALAESQKPARTRNMDKATGKKKATPEATQNFDADLSEEAKAASVQEAIAAAKAQAESEDVDLDGLDDLETD